MISSFTLSESNSFTVTHARHIAAKVATDLKRMQRLYGQPTDADISVYESELTAILKAGYLEKVSYGFRRDGQLVEPTLIYTARDLAGQAVDDDDPGRVRPGAKVSGATFYSYLTRNAAWDALPADQKIRFDADLPVSRSSAPEPGIGGYLQVDRTYSAGGRSLERSSVRSLI